ncbi:hypothetical protein C8034_v002404 [Colletotrichum sidae]|uniref:F-box domain-containing protein n=1 Tax=Colletotrichum sidae TaxID=1347389 RepID=A0A4R8TBQ2_9PEZI|nr:hypothetical protein C8034_v002404 [Colletotrichum sidae]
MPASSLESLPPELLNEIFSYITDPRTLYHLLVASPASSRLFEYSQSGPQALDDVLSHSMAPQICAMVRGVALVRTANPENRRVASLKAFVEQYASPRAVKPTCPLAAPPLAQTLQHQPERTSRCILLTVRRIHHLTSACLEHYRERCLSINPSRAVDPKIRWGEGGEKAWRQDFPGVPYQPAPMAPPTWVEEQRVMRGFWRLQLLCDAERAIAERRLDWDFGEAGKRVLLPELVCRNFGQKDELDTVFDYVCHLQQNPASATNSTLLPAPPEGHRCRWPEQAQPEAPLDSVMGPVHMFGRSSLAGVFYSSLLGLFGESPVRGVPFRPFRELGLAIWEVEKLVVLGLWEPPLDYKGVVRDYMLAMWSNGDKLFRWRSLLSPGDLAEVWVKNEERERRRALASP